MQFARLLFTHAYIHTYIRTYKAQGGSGHLILKLAGAHVDQGALAKLASTAQGGGGEDCRAQTRTNIDNKVEAVGWHAEAVV